MEQRALQLQDVPAAADHAPIGADEFAALMRPFRVSSSNKLAVAVSGGPDSMALALCAHRWAGNNVRAFIVDHALRPESIREAESVKQTLTERGITADILRWHHPTITTRLQQEARTARYRLLAEACRANGIGTILFAHQQEDQAETVLMRFAKGSGIDGLAGIPARTDLNGVTVLRPFLSIPRARLAATCREANVAYVTDPSNESAHFARGRLRRIQSLLAAEGFTVERLLDLAERANDARVALDTAADALLRLATQFDEAGTVRIDLEHLRAAPRAIAMRVLAASLDALNPTAYAPEYRSLARLFDRLCDDTPMQPATLHGCLVAKYAWSAAIMREYSAITHQPTIRPGETILWDERWHVSLAPDAAQGFTIRPLGNPTHEELDRLAPGLRHKIPQGRARAVLPSLWADGKLVLIPGEKGPAQTRTALSWPPKTSRE